MTSGLESLDDREQTLWASRLQAGNLYINRSTTGAIVLRQPFGGMGKSAFGPGIKAGGPNYVVPLMDFDKVALVPEQTASVPQTDAIDLLPNVAPSIPGLAEFWSVIVSDHPAAWPCESNWGAMD